MVFKQLNSFDIIEVKKTYEKFYPRSNQIMCVFQTFKLYLKT